MKNLFYLCIIIMSLISCTNNDKIEECEACTNSNYSTRIINIKNQKLSFKEYSSKNSVIFDKYYSTSLNKNDITDFSKYLSNLGFSNVQALILFSNQQNDLSEIATSSIDAFVVYEMTAEANFNVRAFKNEDSRFIEQKYSNLTTNIISSNDFYSFSRLMTFDNPYHKIISLIDFKGLGKNKQIDKLQVTLKDELKNMVLTNSRLPMSSSTGLSGGEGGCYPPCSPSNEGMCTAQESQSGGESWFCIPDPFHDEACGKRQIDSKLESSNEFDFIYTNDKLYSFRDNYLLLKSGGRKYVDMYYSLSYHLDFTKIDYKFARDTYLLIDEIIPKLELLYDEQNSTSIILIDNNLSNKLITYLITIKNNYNNKESIDNIDFLISKIRDFTNKNNAYITSHL